MIARVLPDVTGLDKVFDYLVPDDWPVGAAVGDRVRVQLHGRRVGGWILELVDHGELPAEQLKPLIKYTGRGPDAEVISLARWAQRRWAARGLRPFLVAASPPRAVRTLPATARRDTDGAERAALAAVALPSGGGVVRVGPREPPDAVIEAAMRRGCVLVVMPSVESALRCADRMRTRGATVAVVPEHWAQAASGVDVVIGTRIAAWARIADLGAIVVFDEHDEAHQEERSPTWHARDVAIERGNRSGVDVFLVSPVPSVVALHWAGTRVVSPTIADSRAAWPIVDIVDRSRDEPWKTSLVTPRLIGALRDDDRTVVCVHNITGRARVLACRSCRSLQRCERCEAAVGLDDERQFTCARCGFRRPAVCQVCAGTGFANLRPGVTRLREELEAAAGRTVVSVTAADAGTPAAAGVYVGTEAVLHRIRRADVVAYLDFDTELLAPRYRTAEQALGLLARGARIVGDRSDGGRLLVQTFIPRHEVLQAVLHADPGRVATVEIARREALRLPPFSALARVSGAGSDEFVAAIAANPDTSVGPAPAGAGWLVRAADHESLSTMLLGAVRPAGSRLRIEVDPSRV